MSVIEALLAMVGTVILVSVIGFAGLLILGAQGYGSIKRNPAASAQDNG